MQFGMAIDILEHAGIHLFVGNGGGVECWPGQLWGPNTPVYLLRDEPTWAMKVKYLHSKVHCKTLELPLNFRQVMGRYQFRTPGKPYGMSREAWLEKCRRYFKSWVDLLKAEKTRQMALPSEMWPLGSEVIVVHAHGAVAVEAETDERPQAADVM